MAVLDQRFCRFRVCVAVLALIAVASLIVMNAFSYIMEVPKIAYVSTKIEDTLRRENATFEKIRLFKSEPEEIETNIGDVGLLNDTTKVSNDGIKNLQQDNTTDGRTPPSQNDFNVGNLKQLEAPLASLYDGANYVVPISSVNVSSDLRSKLKEIGLEPAEDHVFKSPYIGNPALYPVRKSALSGTRELKIISVFKPKTSWNLGFLKSTTGHISYNLDFKNCEYSECVFDYYGKKMAAADLIIYFPGKIGKHLPAARPEGQLWALAEWESPVHFSYPATYRQWKDQFNLTFNYRLDSDIFSPYSRFAWRDKDLLLSDAEYLEIAKRKTKPAAWFVSNCRCQSKRMQYVEEMKKYIDIDVFGRCGKKKCHKRDHIGCSKMLNNTYFFYLGFENSLCKGYFTEKFSKNFLFRSFIIPVVRGGVEYDKYFPKDTFINTKDFPTPRDLARYLNQLMADGPRYARMLREKDRLVAIPYRHDWCDICKNLHTKGYGPRVYPDIRNWTHSGTCRDPADLKRYL